MASFRQQDAPKAFAGLLPEPLEGLTLSVLVSSMFDFYERMRAEGATPQEEDGDMLLFQWGTYGFDGPMLFEANITRQIIYPEGEEQSIWQLSATLFYEGQMDHLGNGERWCHDTSALVDFRKEVFALGLMRDIAERAPRSSRLTFEQQ